MDQSIGIFIILSGLKLLTALAFDLYHSTDFDVHRNWLAITHSLPVEKWYYEATSEWTLDYPPFFAYFEYLLAIPAGWVDVNLVKISARPISTERVILYQKCTVIATDVLVYIGAVSLSKALKFKLRVYF